MPGDFSIRHQSVCAGGSALWIVHNACYLRGRTGHPVLDPVLALPFQQNCKELERKGCATFFPASKDADVLRSSPEFLRGDFICVARL